MKKINNYSKEDLTIVICTYGECPELEITIKSIMNQTVLPKVFISTSTLNNYVQNLADKYGIKIFQNPNKGQINDYNFAMNIGDTPLIMTAHQDDILRKDFVEKSINALNHAKDPIISFTNYIEMHDGIIDRKPSKLVQIKRLMLIPAKSSLLAGTRFGKWLICAFGDPINHPTVIYVRNKLPELIYRERFKASMDWDLWERISHQSGTFVYVDEVLLAHRVDESNQTNILIKTTNARYDDEYDIYCRYWPKPIAKLLMHFYSKAHKFY